MGNYYQALIAVDASESEASSLGDRAVAWLVARGIVAAELTDCVLGGERLGRRPGPGCALTTDEDGPFAPYNHGFRICGLDVAPCRSVTVGWPAPAACPRCGWTDPIEGDGGELTDQWWRIADALGEWHKGGPGLVDCPSCVLPVGLNDWQPDFLASWAVGQLAFTFWNWPVLAKSFIADFSQALGGHRLRHASFKI